ncbi:heme oxygenase 1 [Halyomorpha halys]|uniref:heme oxygenase 1 n=1 Tax=Halyomorpha halys TaxID=286706 RepID=UPI0006D4D4B5|nr:uncharacterized protein LOC106679596 [Halyomorpha halys]
MTEDKIPFNKQLRLVTREIHSVSDMLVNGKLAFALSANTVWAEGLLVFYEVFRYLEEAMDRHKEENLGKMAVEGMFRTEAFEKDLAFYLGNDWKKTYVIRPAVAKYLSHLQSLERENPDYLIAFVYHLYMGLLSGGQILKHKRKVMKKFQLSASLDSVKGENVTNFGDHTIYSIKCKIVSTVNEIAEHLDQKTKDKILEESKNVFLLNNDIINTIEGTGAILIKKLCLVSCICSVVILSYFYFR